MGEYDTYVYTNRAVELIKNHDQTKGPLYIYLAYHNCHGVVEAPDKYVDKFWDKYKNVPNTLKTFFGCLNVMDEGVKNVTQALKDAGMWQNTVMFFNSDNGGHPT